ncbi:MAG: membrane integrity-associated transporter subunit PqiC [Rhizobiales bacterium]|nr:ABC-type transport auxiliary lipoprotein family protein [Hyphomicrobiales bacterium]NRB13851.1 membrane integrity-associated transporter subunit PqiC [Hyphomicrobiales bacterium]
MIVKFSKKLSIIFMAAVLSLLSGCASLMDGLTPVESSQIFDLLPLKSGSVTGKSVNFSLSISEPKAAKILSTDMVLVRPSPVVVQYYENILWSDNIARLVHRRMIQAFEDSQRVKSVGARADGFDTQYDLVMEIRDFHIEPSLRTDPDNLKPLRVNVSLYVKLVDEKTAQVVKSTRISRREEIYVESAHEIALAFNKAFGKIAVSVVHWTLK